MQYPNGLAACCQTSQHRNSEQHMPNIMCFYVQTETLNMDVQITRFTGPMYVGTQ